MNTLRIYIDTSVVGGCFDKDYSDASRGIFRMAKQGIAILIISPILQDELINAPGEVKNVLMDMPVSCMEPVLLTDEVIELSQAYLDDDVVGPKHRNDTLHVAMATVARADVIVSWNFKHIVHMEKIRGFNAVNLKQGYLPIEIRSPLEVVT